MLCSGIVPRQLNVIQKLLEHPCPVAIAHLPRVHTGFACASCDLTVVDVAALTFDEAVELRRRARSGGERICSAYTLDREGRVRLKAAPTSTAVIAVAIGVLLAACEGGSTEASATAPLAVSVIAPQPAALPSVASAQPPDPAPVPPHASASSSAAPQCEGSPAQGSKRASRKRRAREDLEVLGGY